MTSLRPLLAAIAVPTIALCALILGPDDTGELQMAGGPAEQQSVAQDSSDGDDVTTPQASSSPEKAAQSDASAARESAKANQTDSTEEQAGTTTSNTDNHEGAGEAEEKGAPSDRPDYKHNLWEHPPWNGRCGLPWSFEKLRRRLRRAKRAEYGMTDMPEDAPVAPDVHEPLDDDDAFECRPDYDGYDGYWWRPPCERPRWFSFRWRRDGWPGTIAPPYRPAVPTPDVPAPKHYDEYDGPWPWQNESETEPPECRDRHKEDGASEEEQTSGQENGAAV